VVIVLANDMLEHHAECTSYNIAVIAGNLQMIDFQVVKFYLLAVCHDFAMAPATY